MIAQVAWLLLDDCVSHWRVQGTGDNKNSYYIQLLPGPAMIVIHGLLQK
jgi:hypothetical protein